MSHLDPSAPGPVAGIDVGGTKILGVVLDPARPTEVLAEQRIPTPEGSGPLLDAIARIVEEVAGQAGIERLPVGVGIPGLVDLDGVLRIAPHLPGVVDFTLGPTLAERLGVAVQVDNDANCHALAEARVRVQHAARARP